MPVSLRLMTSVALAGLLLAGCVSTRFPPEPPRDAAGFADGLDGDAVFSRTLAAHGGNLRDYPGDINLSTDGRWYALIQRIQPMVTDSGFRIRSEERFRPRDGLYAVRHTGPNGVKHVVRRGDGKLSIHDNGVAESDPVRLRATAMTSDAFRMFHFGPSFFVDRVDGWVRLPDASEGARVYRRILGTVRPGFGESTEDQVVLWVDQGTGRLFRVHMSLNGFETTVGAHVDTTFLDYREVAGYLLPVRFHERVRGPLRIDAHTWWVTGLDAGRGWREDDVTGGAPFRGVAATAAEARTPIDGAARARDQAD